MNYDFQITENVSQTSERTTSERTCVNATKQILNQSCRFFAYPEKKKKKAI